MESAGDGNSKKLNPSMKGDDVPKPDGEETEMTKKKMVKLEAEDHKILGPRSKDHDEEREMMKKIQKLEAEDAYDDPFDLPDNDSDIESDLELELKDRCIADFDVGERIGEKDATSNFKRKEVLKVEVSPEEYEVELDEEEKAYYCSKLYRRRPIGHHFPTREEEKLLKQARRESQNFDIPLLPGVIHTGVFRLNLKITNAAIEAARLSKLALRWYNGANKTDYALQRIVKSNGVPCAYIIYCITFLAERESAPSADPAVTFQARVWVKFNFNIHIMMCRKKGDYDPSRYIDLEIDEDEEEEEEEEEEEDDEDEDEDEEEENEDGDQPQPKEDGARPQPQEDGDPNQPQVAE